MRPIRPSDDEWEGDQEISGPAKGRSKMMNKQDCPSAGSRLSGSSGPTAIDSASNWCPAGTNGIEPLIFAQGNGIISTASTLPGGEMRLSHTILLTVFFLSLLSRSDGQVLGAALESRVFEIGFFQKSFNRKMTPHFTSGTTWSIPTIFVKYGLCKWLTLSVEGPFPWGISKRFPDRDYQHFKFGSGITSRIFTVNDFRFLLSLHYNERFSFDRSESRYHKYTRGIVGCVQIERAFSAKGQCAIFWLSPAYVYDEMIQYKYGSYIAVSDKSMGNLGFAGGVNLVLFKHIESFSHIVYANFVQPRFGIGYRF